MFILDSLLVGGLRFVLQRVADVADTERADPSALREQLLDAHARLEEGTLSEEAFAELERDILARIRDVREGQEEPLGAASNDGKVIGVEATLVEGHEE